MINPDENEAFVDSANIRLSKVRKVYHLLDLIAEMQAREIVLYFNGGRVRVSRVIRIGTLETMCSILAEKDLNTVTEQGVTLSVRNICAYASFRLLRNLGES